MRIPANADVNVSDSAETILVIRNEAQLWDALERALAHDGDELPFTLDFTKADWAKVKVVYGGRDFDSSLSPTAMEGLVEFQASLYRAAASVLRGTADARRLTASERVDLELMFKLGKGSSEAEAPGKGILTVISGAVQRMSGKQIAIAAIILGLAFLGERGFEAWVKAEAAHADKTQLVELSRDIMKHDERQAELLARSLSQSPQAAQVQDQSVIGFRAIVQNSGTATSVTVQGTKLNSVHIEEARRSVRRISREVSLKENFTIALVDPSAKDGFTVWVRSPSTGETIKASLINSLTSDKTRAVIRNAEWKKQKVLLHITGRRVGSEFKNGRILSAKAVSSSPLEMRDRGGVVYREV